MKILKLSGSFEVLTKKASLQIKGGKKKPKKGNGSGGTTPPPPSYNDPMNGGGPVIPSIAP